LYLGSILKVARHFANALCCTQVLFTVNESVRYFTKRGSKVYCAFLDATKAFDIVLHNGIYKKLLDRGAPDTLVCLLQYWYGNLRCRVMWNNVLSESFSVLCGVRQGGVLSPVLFSLYIDDLIAHLWLWYTCWFTVCWLCFICRRHCIIICILSGPATTD